MFFISDFDRDEDALDNAQSEDARSMDRDEEDAIEEVQPNQRSRKRKRNISKPEQRKMDRNSGKSYKTAKSNIVLAKVFQNQDCNCQKKCAETVSEESRKNAFDTFL